MTRPPFPEGSGCAPCGTVLGTTHRTSNLRAIRGTIRTLTGARVPSRARMTRASMRIEAPLLRGSAECRVRFSARRPRALPIDIPQRPSPPKWFLPSGSLDRSPKRLSQPSREPCCSGTTEVVSTDSRDRRSCSLRSTRTAPRRARFRRSGSSRDADRHRSAAPRALATARRTRVDRQGRGAVPSAGVRMPIPTL